MALGWNFNLALDESATINFIISESQPSEGFYLSHTDSTSNGMIYFSSTINIQGNAAPIPEPATMMLLMTGLAGFAGLRRKWF
jgi:hypothetical protein